MGSGKKNKRGGAPKQKGRLAAALVTAQNAHFIRAKEEQYKERKAEREKAVKLKMAGGGPVKIKKTKAQKDMEKLNKAVAEAAAAEMAPEEAEGERTEEVDGVAEGGKKTKAGAAPTAKPAQEIHYRKRPRNTVPYSLNERILLVGEGNFSFAHSLLRLIPSQITPSLLVATSYDSLEAAQSKYPDLMEHVQAIRDAGARVVFGVDATALEKVKEVKEAVNAGGWDKVGFNFPHVGAGITDQDRNVRANQTLLLKFFASVAPLLREGSSLAPTISKKRGGTIGKRPTKQKRPRKQSASSDEDDDEEKEDLGSDPEDEVDLAALNSDVKPAGSVLVTLRTHSPYSLWSLSALATRGPLLAPSILPRPLPKKPQPSYVVRRSVEFEISDYPGYEHRRTVGFKEGVSSGKNEDLTLSARERGLKKKSAEDGKEEVEEGEDVVEARKGKKGSMRTWEFELVKAADIDDAYD